MFTLQYDGPGIRICDMDDEKDHIKRSIFKLLFLRRMPLADTSQFRQQKHNDDLVPAFDGKLTEILDYFDRYQKISYDIQGIRDHGCDLLVVYDYDGESRQIGLQIKSYDDCNEPDCSMKLKAQVTDALNHYGARIQDFYLVFCTDVAKHKDKIRNATADVINIPNFKINVVSPEYALHFLRLPEYLIGSCLKRELSGNDPVVVDASEELSELSLAQSAMVIEAASRHINDGKRALTGDDITESRFVSEVYEKYPNIPAEYFESDEKSLRRAKSEKFLEDPIADLMRLTDHGHFALQAYSELFDFNQESHIALFSLMYEAMARLKYGREDVKWYVFNLLKEYELEIAEKFTARKK